MKSVVLNVNNRKVVCMLKKAKKRIYNDLIILTGAGTIYTSYVTLTRAFKEFNTIIIQTPLHGTKKYMTQGPAAASGEELLSFYTEVIEKLVKEGYCSEKVNILGYSIGGMSLLRLLSEGKINKYIDKAVLLNTAIFPMQEVGFFRDILKTDKFLSKGKGESFKESFGILAKRVGQNKLMSSREAYIADVQCLCGYIEKKDGFTDIDKKTLYITSKEDMFFAGDVVKNTRDILRDHRFSVTEGGHKAYIYHSNDFIKEINKFIKEEQ